MAESVIFGLAAALVGQVLFAEYLGDYLAAISLAIVMLQCLAIAPLRGLLFR
jgi:hypothetical protein